MNNRLKKGLLAPLVLTIVTIGLFGISTVPMVDDVFAEQDKEGKNSNTNGNPAATLLHYPCISILKTYLKKTNIKQTNLKTEVLWIQGDC